MSNQYNNDYPAHFVEKYQHLPYVLLDIPRIVPDDCFQDLWQQHSVPILRLKPDERYPYTPAEAQQLHEENGRLNEYTQANWQGLTVLDNGKADDRWAYSKIDGYKLLPRFMEQLHDYLPVYGFSQVLFWSNQRAIGLHRDLNEQHPFPTSLRIMISDENPKPTFWLQPLPEGARGVGSERLPYIEEQAVYVDTSKTKSNTFVYNNGHWVHGAKKDPAYSKILCSISVGRWRWNDYEKLVDRSINPGL